VICAACLAHISCEVTEELRQRIASNHEPCIHCCREQPTWDGLVCHACLAAGIMGVVEP